MSDTQDNKESELEKVTEGTELNSNGMDKTEKTSEKKVPVCVDTIGSSLKKSVHAARLKSEKSSKAARDHLEHLEEMRKHGFDRVDEAISEDTEKAKELYFQALKLSSQANEFTSQVREQANTAVATVSEKLKKADQATHKQAKKAKKVAKDSLEGAKKYADKPKGEKTPHCFDWCHSKR